jgi:hypothetical protein
MQVSRTLETLRWGKEIDAADLPDHEIELLEQLGGPTLIAVPGADSTRTRVVTTLLHGNEPSGLRAVHRWLRAGRRPATDLLIFIAGVETALHPPHFGHRAMPGGRDLNRCFRAPFEGNEGALAQEVLQRLCAVAPECLVDIHNNTGHNPAYGVACRVGEAEIGLVALFADKVVHAPLELGTIVEAMIEWCPSVTVECGRSGDPVADDLAYEGLCRFLETPDLALFGHDRGLDLLVEPIRVCVASGVDLAFGDDPQAGARLTVSADIDRHNFELLPEGSTIGWIESDAPWPLDARRPDGSECSRELFAIRDGVLSTRREFIPIMMTTRPEIALSDCLFYAAREEGAELHPPVEDESTDDSD